MVRHVAVLLLVGVFCWSGCKQDSGGEPKESSKGDSAPNSPPPASKPRSRPKTTSAEVSRPGKNTGPSPAAQSAGRKPTPLKVTPGAKWVCDNTVATLPPIWRGAEELAFEFLITNAGTAELEINAKGG